MNARMIIPTALLMIVSPIIAADPPNVKPATDPTKAKLIAKTPDAMVHALPHSPNFAWVRKPVSVPGYRLLLTQLPSGEMSTLFETRTTDDGRRRISYNQTRLLGAVADDQRLYLLVATIHQMDHVAAASETITLESLNKDATQNRASIQLLVYWLRDGSQIATRDLMPEKMPKEIAKETTEAGALKLVKNGVKFYETSMTFDGKKDDGAK